MDQKRLEYLRQVERHADETGWVALLTQEDKDHFAYLRKVFKRYNNAPSKATPTEYDFVVRVAESEFILLDFLDRLKGETAIAVSPFYVGGRENDNFYNILAHAHPDSSRISS